MNARLTTGEISRRLLALIGPPFSAEPGPARYTTGVIGQPAVREWAIICPPCELDLAGYENPDEALYLAGVHNDLQHGSRPDAYTVPVYEPDRSPRGRDRFGGGA